jgi:hypothetical protein
VTSAACFKPVVGVYVHIWPMAESDDSDTDDDNCDDRDVDGIGDGTHST